MKKQNSFLAIIPTTIVCLCAIQAVRAGGPSSVASGGTASVRGTVKIGGNVPKAKPINMSADPSCAKQHSGPVFSQDIVADSKGDLENVIVFVSEGLGDRHFDPPAEPAVIEQKGCLYRPHVLAMRVNQPLEVVNDDPTVHNIHPLPANNREWNRAELPGVKVDESFAREEVAIPVKCNVHPWMRGYVAVFKHPFFVVTGKDGSFDLSNLPPGSYTITAWHEKLGTAAQKVTVTGNETKSIDFTFEAM